MLGSTYRLLGYYDKAELHVKKGIALFNQKGEMRNFEKASLVLQQIHIDQKEQKGEISKAEADQERRLLRDVYQKMRDTDQGVR